MTVKEEIATHASTEASALDMQFLHSPDTWVLVAFVIFVALAMKYLLPVISKALDGRAATIRDQLEQASRLRAEAEALLASFKQKQEAMLSEAESIVATAKRDAVIIRERAAEELKATLARRTQQAQEKIERTQAEAIAHIRARIIDQAMESAREKVAQQTSESTDKDAVLRAISAIETHVH